MKVLIVDDDLGVRSVLTRVLTGAGHEAYAVGSGRAAIDFAVRVPPEVLVVDWILPGDMNGLLVARVLSSVYPGLRTVLMSGYPSQDLGDDAGLAGIDVILVKPGVTSDLVETIRALTEDKPKKQPAVTFAVVATDESEDIVQMNPRAREMLVASGCPHNPHHVEEIFGEAHQKLPLSRDEWIELYAGGGEEQWSVRSREWESGRLHVFLRENENSLRTNVIVRHLLNLQKHSPQHWPYGNNVLIIDDSPAVRGMLSTQLERIGCTGYKADSHELAVKLLGADSGIGVAVIDYEMPGVDMATLLSDLKATRADVMVVGSSGRDHRADFARLGVKRYLAKPWTVADLIEIVGEKT